MKYTSRSPSQRGMANNNNNNNSKKEAERDNIYLPIGNNVKTHLFTKRPSLFNRKKLPLTITRYNQIHHASQ
jgi:hypothetical protein